jgi:hypothetical protein
MKPIFGLSIKANGDLIQKNQMNRYIDTDEDYPEDEE